MEGSGGQVGAWFEASATRQFFRVQETTRSGINWMEGTWLGHWPHRFVVDKAFGQRVAREPGDVTNIQLSLEMLAMFIGRFGADAEFNGDFFIGLAFGDGLEHLLFA